MTLTFWAALSVNPASIKKTFSQLYDQYGSIEPLQNVMFTPISQGEGAHTTIHNISDRYDVDVMFDSGGYEVQVGNQDFDELYSYLYDYYRENRWGSFYVLPDNVPVSSDSSETVEEKVVSTISASRTCFRRLPEELKPQAVAVVQGHTKRQLNRCIDAYSVLDGLNRIGFGSFATNGVSHGVNTLTKDTFQNLRWAVDRAHSAGLSVHAFGIGGPTSLPLLAEAGVDSFDTTSWMRSSGYGNVFFPFKSRFNATHRKIRSGKVLTADKLPELKEETNHNCPFCADIAQLRDDRWTRIGHNLIVIHEMAERLSEMSTRDMIEAMDPESKYRQQLETVNEARAKP